MTIKTPHATLHQLHALHRDNLRKNLQHRMEAARARGDEALLRMLEQEARYLQ
jgi:hypothetical protein